MLRIAKGAAQIASAETHEDSGRSRVVALALQRVEYFVDSVHSIKVLRCVVLDVGSLVVARLPYIGAIAVRDGVDNPLGQILGRGVEIENLVDIGVVYLPVNQTLDFGKVAHHAVAVEFLGAAIHVYFPVVAMQVLALALIVEIKLMTSRYFQGFSDVIHIQLFSFQLAVLQVVEPFEARLYRSTLRQAQGP